MTSRNNIIGDLSVCLERHVAQMIIRPKVTMLIAIT